MSNPEDGLGGTDNVRALFSHRPTAAGQPPQQDVIETLEYLLNEARTGKITGLATIAFDAQGNTLPETTGKIVYSSLICELEAMKIFAVLQQVPYLRKPT